MEFVLGLIVIIVLYKVFKKKTYAPEKVKADRITYQPDMVNAGFGFKGRSMDGYGKKLICNACGSDTSATYENQKNQEVVICQICDAILKGTKFAKKHHFHEYSTYP